MARIFVSYRSQQDSYAAIALDDRLAQAFGGDAVFRASRSVAPGENYSDVILRAVKECDVMLVLVGRGWAEQFTDGRDDVDWVRLEIATAVGNGITIVPVLLDLAPRLREDALPSEIAGIARNQYLRFDARTVDEDAARIVTALSRMLPVLDPAGAPSVLRPAADVPPSPETAARSLRSRSPAAHTSIQADLAGDGVRVDLAGHGPGGAVTSRVTGRIARADLPLFTALLQDLTKRLDDERF